MHDISCCPCPQILRGVQTQQRTLVRQSRTHKVTAATYFDACGAAMSAPAMPAEQVLHMRVFKYTKNASSDMHETI